MQPSLIARAALRRLVSQQATRIQPLKATDAVEVLVEADHIGGAPPDHLNGVERVGERDSLVDVELEDFGQVALASEAEVRQLEGGQQMPADVLPRHVVAAFKSEDRLEDHEHGGPDAQLPSRDCLQAFCGGVGQHRVVDEVADEDVGIEEGFLHHPPDRRRTSSAMRCSIRRRSPSGESGGRLDLTTPAVAWTTSWARVTRTMSPSMSNRTT